MSEFLEWTLVNLRLNSRKGATWMFFPLSSKLFENIHRFDSHKWYANTHFGRNLNNFGDIQKPWTKLKSVNSMRVKKRLVPNGNGIHSVFVQHVVSFDKIRNALISLNSEFIWFNAAFQIQKNYIMHLFTLWISHSIRNAHVFNRFESFSAHTHTLQWRKREKSQ